MKRTFLLTVSLLTLTGLAMAHGHHNQIDRAYFNVRPEDFDGRVVEISAQVIAINADSKSMELFDSDSRTLIQVRLTQLPKAERTALMRSNVRRVSVSGRASMVDGRLTINAQRITALPLENNAKDQASTNDGPDGQR